MIVKGLPEDFSRDELNAFVLRKHGNQRWGSHPYYSHLLLVADKVNTYRRDNNSDCYPELEDRLYALSMLHDIYEDTDVTYEELSRRYGTDIADSVVSLSNLKGRKKAETFMKIKENSESAVYVKLCDRIVNVLFSWQNKSRQLFKYKAEHEIFRGILYDARQPAYMLSAWKDLDALLHHD